MVMVRSAGWVAILAILGSAAGKEEQALRRRLEVLVETVQILVRGRKVRQEAMATLEEMVGMVATVAMRWEEQFTLQRV